MRSVETTKLIKHERKIARWTAKFSYNGVTVIILSYLKHSDIARVRFRGTRHNLDTRVPTYTHNLFYKLLSKYTINL